MTTVPRLWPNETVVCVASGPSLTKADVDFVRGKARVIVINTSYRMAPWADCLYACDYKWWRSVDGAKDFPGLKYSLDSRSAKYGVTVLRNAGLTGLRVKPDGLMTGHNSGYQAINLSVLFGARHVVLLGYDMQRGPHGKLHWHGNHEQAPSVPLAMFIPMFETMVQPLRELGVSVVNCSRSTALNAFPKMSLREAFQAREVAA